VVEDGRGDAKVAAAFSISNVMRAVFEPLAASVLPTLTRGGPSCAKPKFLLRVPMPIQAAGAGAAHEATARAQSPGRPVLELTPKIPNQ
jgi:hypothetical protein